VPEELVAQSSSGVCTLNEAGYVGHHARPVMSQFDNPEVRHKSSERVVGDLRSGSGHGRQQSGFAGIWEPDQTDVGKQFQLQLDRSLFRGPSGFREVGCLPGRCGKPGVPSTAISAFGDDKFLTFFHDVTEKLASPVVENLGAAGYVNHDGLTIRTVPVRSFSVGTTDGYVFTVVPVVVKGTQLPVTPDGHTPASAAITAVGTTARSEFLPPEADRPVPAIASEYFYDRTIYESHVWFRAPLMLRLDEAVVVPGGFRDTPNHTYDMHRVIGPPSIPSIIDGRPRCFGIAPMGVHFLGGGASMNGYVRGIIFLTIFSIADSGAQYSIGIGGYAGSGTDDWGRVSGLLIGLDEKMPVGVRDLWSIQMVMMRGSVQLSNKNAVNGVYLKASPTDTTWLSSRFTTTGMLVGVRLEPQWKWTGFMRNRARIFSPYVSLNTGYRRIEHDQVGRMQILGISTTHGIPLEAVAGVRIGRGKVSPRSLEASPPVDYVGVEVGIGASMVWWVKNKQIIEPLIGITAGQKAPKWPVITLRLSLFYHRVYVG
jgi:hypothetical protein